MRWRLDNQDGFADSPYSKSKTLTWSVWTWILHTSFDVLQHCLNQLEALIPEAAGGPRLRCDARPWIIMMASSVHYADNAGRHDTLKRVLVVFRLHDFGCRKRWWRIAVSGFPFTAFTGNLEQSIWLYRYIMQITLWSSARIEILIRKGVFGLTSNIIERKTWLVERVRENVA